MGWLVVVSGCGDGGVGVGGVWRGVVGCGCVGAGAVTGTSGCDGGWCGGVGGGAGGVGGRVRLVVAVDGGWLSWLLVAGDETMGEGMGGVVRGMLAEMASWRSCSLVVWIGRFEVGWVVGDGMGVADS